MKTAAKNMTRIYNSQVSLEYALLSVFTKRCLAKKCLQQCQQKILKDEQTIYKPLKLFEAALAVPSVRGRNVAEWYLKPTAFSSACAWGVCP